MPVRPRTVAAVTMTILFASTVAAQDAQAGRGRRASIATSQPILRKRCANCHNAERPRGELDLTSYAGVVAGGASGKAAVAGQPRGEPDLHPAGPPRRPQDAAERRPGSPSARSTCSAAGSRAAWSRRPATRRSHRAVRGRTVRAAPAGGLVPPEVPPARHRHHRPGRQPRRDPIAAVSGHRRCSSSTSPGRSSSGPCRSRRGTSSPSSSPGTARRCSPPAGSGPSRARSVLFETKDWARIATLGDEFDAVLAADLSPDDATGRARRPEPGREGHRATPAARSSTPSASRPTGSRPPPSAPTACSSPPGDRFGGLFLWETRSGQEFLDAPGPRQGDHRDRLDWHRATSS